MSDVVLRTERLILRRMVMADAQALHAMMSDAETMRYWSSLPHTALAETEAWIDTTMAAVAAGSSDDFAVTLDDVLIGKAGVWRPWEVGILIDRRAWGRGLATEALRAVIARSRSRGATRITAEVDPRNTASLKLLIRLGFRETGQARNTYCLGGEWSDSVYLALTPDESAGFQFGGG